MARLVWDKIGDRRYETGVDQGVLFLPNLPGIPWNGLVEVADSPNGGTVSSYWCDGVKYLDVVGNEDYSATISAYTYPDEFEQCQGLDVVQGGLFATAQHHSPFSFSYRTKIGNDTAGPDYAYRLHIVMNAMVAPLDRDHKSLTNTPEAETFKWDISATPIAVPGMKPTAHLIIDSRYTDPTTLAAIESVLYGDDQIQSHLPTMENLINLIVADGSITITDNGDGTWTAIGPNEFITMLDDKTFQITNANTTFLDDNTYTIQDTDT